MPKNVKKFRKKGTTFDIEYSEKSKLKKKSGPKTTRTFNPDKYPIRNLLDQEDFISYSDEEE